MKSIILVSLALVAIVAAAPPASSEDLIVRSSFNQDPNGKYDFAFETQKGIQRSEAGELKQVLDEDNKPRDVITVRGSFTYYDDQGKSETINYYADETGYHAEGPSIPQVPARR